MGKIEIVSASAGSGKTHHLTTLLVEEIRQGRVRPEAVVATTFTVRAAAELRERVRRELLRAHLPEEAQRILAARFGTVNSVCGRLLSEHVFELGLSPSLRVLDEKVGKRLLRQALEEARTARQEEIIEELGQRFDFLLPEDEQRQKQQKRKKETLADVVQKVMDLARSNRLGPGDLAECARKSLESLRQVLPPALPPGRDLKRELHASLATFIAKVGDLPEKTKAQKNVQGALQMVAQFVRALESARPIPWNDWAALETADPGTKAKPLFAPVAALAREHAAMPEFIGDAARLIELVFDLAARALQRYCELKAERGLIDFIDQEVYALSLLERDEVRRRLEGQIDLVIVDEFQDTSPIQLAIFLCLARVAKRSVWVGDQKQAIYGFRGTDPALMDAALRAVLGSEKPKTLGVSYRSRPELVRLTSALFAPAFGARDIPPDRVRLTPAQDEEPAGLGPIVERWTTTGNKDVQAAGLASGVRGLLDDERALVRDRETGEARRARGGDVAILCRINDDCESVATALEVAGLRVARARTGLFDTHEGRLVLAGLRLWLDETDRLARAEVERLLDFPDRPGEWLAALVRARGEPAALSCVWLDRLRKAELSSPAAGALAVFDGVCRAFDVEAACQAWGEAEARLANLEAMRELAIQYESDMAGIPGATSPGGLLAYLEQLKEREEDEKPARMDSDSVVVSTWHGSKGLEWPIVVLFGIEKEIEADPWEERIIPSPSGIDLADPLAGRFIRYWPRPYNKRRKHGALLERVQASEAAKRDLQSRENEMLRLLYVVWTRARDRVILACKEGSLAKGCLDLLNRPEPVIAEPAGEVCAWAGQRVELALKRLEPAEPRERAPEDVLVYPRVAPVEHSPAFANPSELVHQEPSGRAEDAIAIGQRIEIRDTRDGFDPTDLGHAVHGFFAADRPGLDPARRRRLAEGLLLRWRVSTVIDVEDLLRSADAFWLWAERAFGRAKAHREMPIEHRLESGTVVRGFCDLALETRSGWVVVDHKAVLDDSSKARERAAGFAAQLAAYARAISATGRTVAGMFVHMPVLGLVFPVST